MHLCKIIFFVNVGPITEQTIPRNPVVDPVKYLKNRNQFNFLVTNISNEEVLNIIKNLEDKSTGPQSIPIKLLKLIPDLIFVPLCKIISMSFSSGKFPDPLKICKTIPIHKGGSTILLNNYRPNLYYQYLIKLLKKSCIKGCITF